MKMMKPSQAFTVNEITIVPPVEGGSWVEVEPDDNARKAKAFKYAVISVNAVLYTAIMTYSFVPAVRDVVMALL